MVDRRHPTDVAGHLRAARLARGESLGDLAEVEAGPLGGADFRPALNDFYLSNPIARSSALMGQLSAMAAERSAPAMAAE